jgi:hypothetical protein
MDSLTFEDNGEWKVYTEANMQHYNNISSKLTYDSDVS